MQVIPCHFAAPVKAGPTEFKNAFAFAYENLPEDEQAPEAAHTEVRTVQYLPWPYVTYMCAVVHVPYMRYAAFPLSACDVPSYMCSWFFAADGLQPTCIHNYT